jgi:hypothetical protein
MRKHLSHHDVANYVRMIRTQHQGAILIVEGDKDRRIYERFINGACCKVVYASGKANAIGALAIIEKGGVKGVLGIVDSDFWKLDGIEPATANVMLTDTHDLETELLASGVLERILSELGAEHRIKKINKQIQDFLIERGVPLGLLRWISSPTKDNLSFRFKDLRYEKFLDKKTLDLNIDEMIREVVANSGSRIVNENAIKSKIITLQNEGHDPWQICSGHDLIEILFFGLKYVFGNEKGRKIPMDILDSMIRIAFNQSYFWSTNLYKSIQEWERRNPPFKVLQK